MKDTIYRQDAIDAIDCDITVTGRQNAELVAATIGTFADRIKALPSAEKTGEWIRHPIYEGSDHYYYACSECDYRSWSKDNFCSVCGAKMEA